MIEDFQPSIYERNKKKVLNAKTDGPKKRAFNVSSPAPTAGAYAPSAEPEPLTRLPLPPHMQQNVEPANDSLDSPYSTELFDWQDLWNEFKGTLIWILILINTSLLSYYMGTKKKSKPKNKRRNTRSSRTSIEMNSMPRRHTDGFHEVSLHPYESVASLPLPLYPDTTTTTRL